MSERSYNVILGASFRSTWVSSGATPSKIFYEILSGSESLVNSLAGVSSGNGHYYVDPVINSIAGWYVGRWTSWVNSTEYKNVEYLSAFPKEVGQAGRYTNWDLISHKYADFPDFGGAVQAASTYISIAEAYIESRLAPAFSVPFSNNNVTIRTLATDQAYLEAARRSLDEKQYKRINDHVENSLKMILAGDMQLVTDDGASSAPDISGAWSSTQDYHPITGPHDPLDWVPSSQQNIDLLADRGIVLG